MPKKHLLRSSQNSEYGALMCDADLRDFGFAPLVGDNCCVLILGSMPSQASLELQQYYAHPQNAFWRIMAQLADVPHTSAYQQRVANLTRLGVSVWDTIHSCYRPGSMDADIDPATVRVNNFGQFFECHSDLRLVCFNGRASEQTFRKHLGAKFLDDRNIRSQVMPSTSPAYAAMRFEQKSEIWLNTIRPFLH